MTQLEIIIDVVFAVLSAVCFYFMWKEIDTIYNKLKDKHEKHGH